MNLQNKMEKKAQQLVESRYENIEQFIAKDKLKEYEQYKEQKKRKFMSNLVEKDVDTFQKIILKAEEGSETVAEKSTKKKKGEMSISERLFNTTNNL